MCDLAETYHILNYRERPASLIATLANGLPSDSRCSRKIEGRKLSTLELLNASVLDACNMILWTKTEDATKGVNRPNSVLQVLEGRNDSTEAGSDVMRFTDITAFEEARKQAIEKGG